MSRSLRRRAVAAGVATLLFVTAYAVFEGAAAVADDAPSGVVSTTTLVALAFAYCLAPMVLVAGLVSLLVAVAPTHGSSKEAHGPDG